jgi:hypothetical protein
MTIIQLNPIIPVETPRGRGNAHLMIDYGEEHHLHWVIFLDDNGECWTYANTEIRLQANPTLRPKACGPSTIPSLQEQLLKRPLSAATSIPPK